jgi:hypothetical protein
MAFADFTAYTVFDILEWPPAVHYSPMGTIDSGGVVVTFGFNMDGTVVVVLANRPRTRFHEFRFQAIEVDPPSRTIMMLTYSDGVPTLEINGELLPLEHEPPVPTIRLAKRDPFDGTMSWDAVEADVACAAAVTARATYFANKKPFDEKLPHRPKTLDEQLEELRATTIGLTRLMKNVKKGAREDLGFIAIALRGLLLAPTASATWNPILLRLANLRSLPLPIYLLRPTELPVGGYTARYRSSSASIWRTSARQVVTDLSEYLEAVVMGTQASGATVANLVHKLASSAAPGHFDETVAKILDEARLMETQEGTFIDGLLMNTALVTVMLSDHVLLEYGIDSGIGEFEFD